MSDPIKAESGESLRTCREVHGYDLADRLDHESGDGALARLADSAYDEFWRGEESA